MSEPKYKEWILRVLSNRCVTCKHWSGDRDKDMERFEESPISMDIDNGWASNGSCGEQYRWAEIDINGNATADLTIPASFGCVLHEMIANS